MSTPTKALLTGMNGTVAPVLATLLEDKGVEVIAWNRNEVPTDNRGHMAAFIESASPDWFFQIAAGSPPWIADTAAMCHEQKIRFLLTGSVSGFGPSTRGPFTLESAPDATDDYGRYKQKVEEVARAANPECIIARLGWQIGEAPGSNNMVDYATNQVAEHGQVTASSKWYPSCAFLTDSAAALYQLMVDGTPDTYQLKGNPGLTFYEVLTPLKERQKADWDIVETQDPNWDNRMVDDRVPLRPIRDSL